MRRQCTKPCANCGAFVQRVRDTYCSYRCRGLHLRRPIEDRLWEKVDKTANCWLWQGSRSNFGHGYIALGGRGDGRIGVHHLSYALHIGPVPDGLWVLHRCDVPHCVNPDHLFVGTQQDNVNDMLSKGRHARGSDKSGAKLNDDAVRAIRVLLADGVMKTEIGRRFNVTDTIIRRIERGQAWGHVT